MSSKRKQEILKEQKSWERIDETVVSSERFLEKYQNHILIVVLAALVIVGGIWAYNHFYMAPKNKEAQAAMFRGEQYFQAGQDSLAIYGDGNEYQGFEALISEYGSTKAGKLAHYYAGISYSRMGKYEEALAHLKDFSSNDLLVQYAAKGAIGDCLANTGKTEEAAKYFVEAAKGADSPSLSPIYYKKAGIVYRELKNHDKVIEMFTAIKNNYQNTPEAAEADKYIEEARLLKSNS